MTSIGDPTFGYHLTVTRIWGLVALRLANSDILPFDFGANGAALRGFLTQLQRDNKIDAGRLPLKQLQDRVADFQTAGEQLRELTLNDLAAGNSTQTRIRRLNNQLFQVESNWLNPAGIPGRPWFQHILYAARYTYAHLELPGLTEAVEAGNWTQATDQADVLDAAVLSNTNLLRSAAGSWRSGQ
jgi:N-acetylated-alpha-linked acidic dipeptidase